MVPCEPDMICVIATKVMLLTMGYLWCGVSRIIGKRKQDGKRERKRPAEND